MSCIVVGEGFMVKINSCLRMLGFEDYVFKVAFGVFICFFPVTLLFCIYKLQTGAFMTIALLGISNTTVSLLLSLIHI